MDTTEDSCRIDVWVSMAEHFLDTETRQDIPWTALKCVQAQLSAEEARNIWNYEVSPAVAMNLCAVAGEWAGWNRDWLVARIQQVRIKWRNGGAMARLFRRPWFIVGQGMADSLDRCIRALLAVEGTEDRERLARDLTFLAAHYFDFCPKEVATLGPGGYERLRSLSPEPFRYLMEPALVRCERAKADERIETALRKGASC